MKVEDFDEKIHLDDGIGCRCRYVRSDVEPFIMHRHNYYEIFIVLCGDVTHLINGKEQTLASGQLLFVRDFDAHTYRSADGNYFEFLNLAFSKCIFDEMVEYLGDGFPARELIDEEFPPMVTLSDRDKEKMFYAITNLVSGTDKKKIRMKLKALLLQIFMQYFYEYSQNKTEVPLWLETTYEKIKKPENFIQGIGRLYEICPKSREHLSRSLKKYYGTSPSALVTDLRLEYSINLLTGSNLSVTEVCFECGFENISWFYKAFEQKFGTTPLKYRKKYNIQ